MAAPLRYGILGAANIARQFTRGVAGSALATVEAVASRDAAKAAAFAAELGIPRHHASYAALLADPAIEAIYIPLPNDMHCEWAIRCMEAGKHVLCEKPLAMNAAEARRMYDAARKRCACASCCGSARSARSRSSPPPSASASSRPTAPRCATPATSACCPNAAAAACWMPAPIP
jgi:hypothetical protein